MTPIGGIVEPDGLDKMPLDVEIGWVWRTTTSPKTMYRLKTTLKITGSHHQRLGGICGMTRESDVLEVARTSCIRKNAKKTIAITMSSQRPLKGLTASL